MGVYNSSRCKHINITTIAVLLKDDKSLYVGIFFEHPYSFQECIQGGGHRVLLMTLKRLPFVYNASWWRKDDNSLYASQSCSLSIINVGRKLVHTRGIMCLCAHAQNSHKAWSFQ